MRMDRFQGISSLSDGKRRSAESVRRKKGYFASLAFQEPSTFIHPGGACKPHPRFKRMGSLLGGTSASLSRLVYQKSFLNPVPRNKRLILGKKGDGPSKDKNRHANQAPRKQVHSVGLPPLRRYGPGTKKEEQWEVEDVKTVGESCESMGNVQVMMRTRPEFELENAEQKQREGN